MAAKKIVVPEGMLAAAHAGIERDPCTNGYLRPGLEAALEWLSDNPLTPSDEQWAEASQAVDRRYRETVGPSFSYRHAEIAAEWQRRMFLAPPEPLEENGDILDMIAKYPRTAHECIIEAYRLGKKAGR